MSEIRKFIILPDRVAKPEQKQDPTYRQAQIFLDMFNLCSHNQQLPRPGGLLEQDSLYVHLMRHAINCVDERRKMDEAHREIKAKSRGAFRGHHA